MPENLPTVKVDTSALWSSLRVLVDNAFKYTQNGEISLYVYQEGEILNFQVKERGKLLGFEKTFLLGLTNDALGYIITEDEYRHKTYESTISLFGPTFGSFIANEALQLIEKLRPVEKKKSQ